MSVSVAKHLRNAGLHPVGSGRRQSTHFHAAMSKRTPVSFIFLARVGMRPPSELKRGGALEHGVFVILNVEQDGSIVFTAARILLDPGDWLVPRGVPVMRSRTGLPCVGTPHCADASIYVAFGFRTMASRSFLQRIIFSQWVSKCLPLL